MTNIHRTDADWDTDDARRWRDRVGDEVSDRIDRLAATVPNLHSRIVGRLCERAPEILALVLDDIVTDIEAGR